MIDRIGTFLQQHLIIFVAVVLVPIKLAVLRWCGDNEGTRAAFLSLPEDLVYISLGLILGDITASRGAFHRWFSHSANAQMDLYVTVGIGILVAVVVHLLAKWTNDHFKTWRAASAVSMRKKDANPQQHDLGLPTLDANVLLIQIRHLALASILYLLQLWVTLRWLEWIARVLANK